LKGFKHINGKESSAEEIESIFNEIDRNSSGFIDYHGKIIL
jgi:hypothetical protein